MQIECKDWSDPVGIAVVDALDSKRRDIGADRSIIFSNSGFTNPALLKAARVGIELASALRAGDSKVRLEIHKRVVAKRLSVDNIRVVLYPLPTQLSNFPGNWQLDALRYDDLPVRCWLAPISQRLLREHEGASSASFRCTFRPSSDWTYDGSPISVDAMVTTFALSRSWVGQTVREDVTLGLYDHLKRTVAVPAKQGYLLGVFDRDGWEPETEPPTSEELAPNSFEILFTLMNPLLGVLGMSVPQIDEIVLEQDVVLG